MTLPLNIQQSVSRYKPIEAEGLTLYPILVKHYDEFAIARPSLEVMHQSFPVRFMRVPLLSALYAMDYEAVLNGTTPSGLFSRALLALALSLRLGEELELEKRLELFRIAVDREKPEKLLRVQFTDSVGKEYDISPPQFKILREIIAAQNGVRLEDDKANPDLVEAQKKMTSAKSVALDVNINTLICAVATLSQVDEAEIDEWPILKLENKAQTFRRIIDYMICGIGEANGTEWKGGNPNPHPFFARIENGSGLLSAIGGKPSNTPGSRTISAPPDAAIKLAEQTKSLL